MSTTNTPKAPRVLMPNVVTIELLLQYYYSGEEIKFKTTQALLEANQFLVKNKLVHPDDDGEEDSGGQPSLCISAKGRAWVEFILLKCPLPQPFTQYRVEVVEAQ